MCSHYEAPSPGQLALAFGVEPIEQAKLDLWPGYFGPFVRGVANRDDPEDFDSTREVLSGSFGLIPGWSKDTKIARRCYNVRSETAAVKPSFRNAWKHGQHCIIPAAAFYEPDWRSGKAIATRITRSDGEPMGIAGLWERWKSPSSTPARPSSARTCITWIRPRTRPCLSIPASCHHVCLHTPR